MTTLMAAITRTPESGTITLRHTCRTTVADTWNALTEPDRLARWLAPVTGDLREGGHYLLTFGETDSETVRGTIEQCRPGEYLRVTWQAPGDPVSSVSVTLTGTDEGTELLLVHEGLEHRSDTGHAAGWQLHIGSLDQELAAQPVSDEWGTWPELRKAYADQLSTEG